MTRLKKIEVGQLSVGMYFSGFDGAWIDTPFWRTSFLVRKASEIARARAAGYTYCWIDTDQGIDLAGAEADRLPETEEPEAAGSSSSRSELDDALRLYENAKQTTQQMFKQARLGKTLDVENCKSLVEEIATSVARDSNALLSIIRLKRVDEYTYLHSIAVCTLMVALARTLGMDDIACKEAGLAGYLHDVGKAFIPLEILNKPDRLSEQEYKIIQRHPALGYDYLKGFSGVPDYVLDVCLHHHEKIDGSGYPSRHQGNQISVYSRMAAVCDVYDAVTSERPYKSGWDPAESLSRMASWQGHFDRPIFLAFVKALGIYPIGSIVKLQSGRTALVIRQNHVDLTKPVVKAFVTTPSIEVVESEIIDLSAPGQTDAIAERSGQDWLKSNGLVIDSLKAMMEASDLPMRISG
ncbi:HD-GYP domain-containing protein [Herbaspirillum seropedicae]|uniref:HD-GYP domain containing protein n=1 Tax=Herbaspirillum seropedicae (strain SmR1) TaxID=757424 RepID=D8J0Q8_HERSS|nr:HD-GYP domain-containing protein [Herbaspirillum seropedicae]ADJ62463.1 HD-GYP domain containing protein [Herbaspirillum seropedicae SmR1]AKN64589.1 phosphodiesterase [Herbaspirillum seropedicae]AON53177.1 HD-GYP domain-containing protein [Herbaspirillum seropedicae]NQE30993.1 phosphodiesterase [Herbaspirillum seropedicae]UMU20525.1 HD-GYP domain-containing protein [Herbaspirillum seropedicae]